MTTEEINNLFQANLRILREELGISQSELARRIGQYPAYICDLENGRRTTAGPTLATLAAIADALGVNPSMLISTALSKK